MQRLGGHGFVKPSSGTLPESIPAVSLHSITTHYHSRITSQHPKRRQANPFPSSTSGAMQQRRSLPVIRSLCLMALSLVVAQAANSAPGSCPNECELLPQKARTAAGLAVSMVVMTSCEGDIDGAARAVASAAADGDLHAFGAGLSIGAAALTGPEDEGRGQMAQIMSETLTVADSKNRTTAVASAIGNALAAMPGTAGQALANETVTAINDLADGSCSAATNAAASVYFSLKPLNATLAGLFKTSAQAYGKPCWVRRFNKLQASPVFNMPPPSSPCTRRMRDASATSLSLVTATSCRLDKSTPVAAAAYALVTASVKDGCSFASAVAASTALGLPAGAVQDVFTAAITKAGADKKLSQLSNAFAATFTQLEAGGSGADGLLDNLLTAVDRTVAASGCDSAKAFTKGLFSRLVAQDPGSVKATKAAFTARPNIAACKYPL